MLPGVILSCRPQDDKDVLREEIEVREVRIKRSKQLQADEQMRREILDQISTKK